MKNLPSFEQQSNEDQQPQPFCFSLPTSEKYSGDTDRQSYTKHNKFHSDINQLPPPVKVSMNNSYLVVPLTGPPSRIPSKSLLNSPASSSRHSNQPKRLDKTKTNKIA